MSKLLTVVVASLSWCVQEASLNPLCRRLVLKDLLPTAWQRLTKYRLLIEKLLSCSCMSGCCLLVQSFGNCCRMLMLWITSLWLLLRSSLFSAGYLVAQCRLAYVNIHSTVDLSSLCAMLPSFFIHLANICMLLDDIAIVQLSWFTILCACNSKACWWTCGNLVIDNYTVL